MQDNWNRFAVEAERAGRDFGAIAEPLGGEVLGDEPILLLQKAVPCTLQFALGRAFFVR